MARVVVWRAARCLGCLRRFPVAPLARKVIVGNVKDSMHSILVQGCRSIVDICRLVKAPHGFTHSFVGEGELLLSPHGLTAVQSMYPLLDERLVSGSAIARKVAAVDHGDRQFE